MSDHTLERELEWEPATAPIVLQHGVWPVPPFIAGTRKITIQRDDNFQLHLLAEGVFADSDDFKKRMAELDALQAGTQVDHDDLAFEANGSRFVLSVFLKDLPETTSSRDHAPRFQQKGHVLCFARTLTWTLVVGDGGEPVPAGLGPAAWRTDWFINGPHDPLFLRSTKRRRKTTFSRERPFNNITVVELPRGGDGRDHFVVDTGQLRFAACQVPDEFAPDWCHAVGIEYALPLPDEETREAVGEIVSFVIGRRLLRLGSTVFDATGATIQEEAVNPIGDALRALCSGSDHAPVPLATYSTEVETALAALVPSYLKLRSPLGLRNALWAYWSACEAPAPIDLALFRAAVEALKTRWFASAGTKSGGVYLAKAEYEKVTKEPFDTVEKALTGAVAKGLADQAGAATILNKLGGAYRMGNNEQVRTFFEEIGLPIGAAEREAMKAANVPAHGGITTGGNIKTLDLHGRAYRALFERTFLRLLGYGGRYVDRATLGFPSRALEEPAGGSPL
jgi:hypothetical protein